MSMKKIVGLTAVFLILAGVMLSEQAMAQKATPITKENMATLKGNWEGKVDFKPQGTCSLMLRIDNDTPPLKGHVEFQNLPQGAGGLFPGNFGNETTYGGDFENGIITNTGTLLISGKQGNFGEFSLVGKNLSGWFYIWGARGTVTLKKK